MLRIITIIASTALLAACGSETSGEFTTDEGETGEYSINEESGETTATIETDEGTTTLRSGAEVPLDLPDGFSLYPGASVTSNTVVSQEGQGQVVLLSFETEDSAEDVSDFYKQQAEEAGVTIELDMSVNEGRMLVGQNADGATFSLNVTPEEGRTLGQLTTGLRLGG